MTVSKTKKSDFNTQTQIEIFVGSNLCLIRAMLWDGLEKPPLSLKNDWDSAAKTIANEILL